MSALDDLRSVEKELKAGQSPALADIRKINAESKIADSLAVDADRAARVQAAERDFGVPRDIATKHLDLLEQKRRPDLTGIFDESPVTARHLQNPDYAALVSDELDKQRALERSTRGYWENIGRGVLGRTATLTGNLLEFGGRVLNREGIDAATPFLGVGGGQNPIGDFLTKTGKAISEGSKVYDYVPQYDWERVKTDFGAQGLAGFIVEQGIVSLPDMAATVALPAYIASRTEEIGEDRAKNKGLAEPTIEDLVQAAAPAVLVSLLEKVGAKAVFDLAAVETFKQAGKAALSAGKREAATEFAQEIIEYGGTTLGTDVEFDPYEALDRGLAGAVAGGGFGSAVRGATANYQAALNQYGRSMIEQDVIDKFNDVADGKLRDRSIEKLKAYAEDVGASYGIDTIRVDGDVFNQDGLKLQGLKAPAESGDVEMSVGDYVSLPKETRAEIRPFVRIQPDSMSQIEAQSWEEGQQAQLDRMIKSAKVKAENYEKANALSKGLAEQLIATGRYNKTQALMMSKIDALYLTVKAEREGITVEEAHAMLPLTIERIDGQQGAGLMDQPAYHGSPYRFDKFSLDAIGTGEGAQVYGHGLYFAGRKEVAEWYRQKLSSGESVIKFTNGDDTFIKTNNGWVSRENGYPLEFEEHLAAEMLSNGADLDAIEAEITEAETEDYGTVFLYGYEWSYDDARKAVALVRNKEVEQSADVGQLYEVDIPDDGDYLLWDEPLTGDIEKRVADASVSEGLIEDAETAMDFLEELASGQELYRGLSEQLGGDKEASDFLKSIGIPGIKYLDGSSTAAGEGSYNYVIFSDEDVQITQTFYQSLPNTIEVDGVQRPTKRSDGNPIHPTEEGVRNFWGWFGDSQVVDDQGRPLVVYHGTQSNIFQFDKRRDGTISTFLGSAKVERYGIFVTPSRDLANEFAMQGDRGKQESANVMPLYTSIKNPLDMTEGYPESLFAAVEAWAYKQGLDGYRVARNLGDNWGDWALFDNDGGQDPEFLIGMLSALGYDGVKYFEPAVGGEGASGESFVAFRPEQIKSATGNTGAFDPNAPSILAQDNTRAHIQFSEVGAVIRLGKTSDLSSFFHEAGHYFLAMEQKFAAHPNATERQKKDFQAILDYIGAPDGNIQREHHEKFARAFERYIGEGRAPSVELKSYFRRFAQWIMQVYTTLKNLDVELTPEIRDVFDRMLATDDQIARASQKFWYEIVPTDKEAEVKSKQKERQEQAKQNTLNSKDRGTERLRSRLIKELKARGEAEQRAERKALIDQNKADLSESQRYKAIAWLKDNQVSRDDALEVIGATSPKIPKVLAWVKENNLTEADIRQLQSTGSADLKKQKLVEWMKENEVTPQEVVQALDPKVQAKRRKLNGITSKDGIPLDDAAELLGYPSGHAMITDIAEGPTLSEEASRLADEQMKAKHGDMLTDGSIEKMADEIMHSEEQAKALLAQLKALRPSSRLDNEAIKQEAKEIIGRLPAAKIKPDTYYRAEVKHAREYEKALAAGDVAMAAYHAQQRLVQFHLAREATFVKARVDRQRKALKGWQERKYADTAVDPRYAQNLRTYATLWDFRKSSKDEEAEAFSRLERVAAWLAAQANDENRFLQPQILDSILSRVQQGLLEGRPISIPSYETMTVDELQGVYDMASHLRWMGGQMSKEAAFARKAEAEEVAASVEENSDREYIEPDIENLPKADIFSFARRFAADHIYLRRKLEQMDGNKDGVLKRLVWDPIVRASNRKYAMRMESADALKEILAPIEDKTLGRGKGKFTVTKGDGTSWTLGTRERIMLALYWGNQYSRDAIMEGHGVTEDEVMQMLSSLKDVELDAVENLWKFNDRYWPEFSAVNTRMFGATPPKVEPLPYRVNGREMSGGYMSISYRPSAKDAKRGKDIYEDHASKMLNGNRSMAMSQSGAAIERTGSGGRMVSLEMQNIATAAEEAIHTIAFSETSRAIGRLMTNEVVASAIRKHHSPEGYQSLVDNLTSIMVGDRPPTSKFMQFMRWTRQNLTLAILGYSVRNFVQQPTGYFNVVGKVGEVAAFKGLLEFYSSPFAHMENIKARSVFMRNRVRMVNREVAEIMGEIGTGKEGVFRKYALAHQIVGDSTIVYAAWLAGYKQGLAKHGDEQKAIAYADDIVASTVGSGMSKDMSPMLQGSGLLGSGGAGSEISKQFTFMGSFFNLTINLLEESYKKNKPMKSAKGAANFGRQAFWYLVPPAIVGKILVSSIPGDDDDEAWWQWALSSVAEYGLGSIFFIRDIVSMYKGFNPSIPYQSSFVQFGKGLQELAELFEEDDEIEWSDVKNVVSAAAVVRPMPGVGQVTRTGGYIDSYLKGDEESYVEIYDALVEGKERD